MPHKQQLKNLVQVVKPTVEGWFWATAVLVVIYYLTPSVVWTPDWQPSVSTGLFRDTFARRVDGRCSGWTYDLAIKLAAAEVIAWYAYVTIAFVLYRLPPAPRYMNHTKLTILAIFWLFIFCGATHLMVAYTVFNPLYNMKLLIVTLNSLIAYVGAFRIAYSLSYAFKMLHRAKVRVDKIIALAAAHGIVEKDSAVTFDGVAEAEIDAANRQAQGAT